MYVYYIYTYMYIYTHAPPSILECHVDKRSVSDSVTPHVGLRDYVAQVTFQLSHHHPFCRHEGDFWVNQYCLVFSLRF